MTGNDAPQHLLNKHKNMQGEQSGRSQIHTQAIKKARRMQRLHKLFA